MATAAILPVKRFADAKKRLQPLLGAGSRQALASAMFADVLSTLGRSTLVERLIVVSGERQVRDAVFDTDVVLIDDTPDDLAELGRAFDEHRGRAPRTEGVMRQFERSRRSAIPA